MHRRASPNCTFRSIVPNLYFHYSKNISHSICYLAGTWVKTKFIPIKFNYLQKMSEPDIEGVLKSLSESEMRIETRRFGSFTFYLSVDGIALAPLYQPVTKNDAPP